MSDIQAAKVPAEATPLRRQPVQQRSAKRVEQMLDASAALIDELGYDALTTTLIAKRAGVAVGSLYQFFPDKRAVVQALTARNLERFVGAVNERLNQLGPEHWWDVVDSILDIYLEMHRSVPGFSKVHFGDIIDRQLLDETRDNNAVIVDSLTDLLASQVDRPVEDLRFAITIANEVADALLKLAFRKEPSGDEKFVAEAKYVVKGYLAARFGEKS
ncbi:MULTISPECIES: TetR/AcrR family transcriptional regulator [unclassified Amycolatopsis]|uniref:TetR/AcrR family transcriptional regulator n=1 Tax=unclassified Amycolatopsis TaxID=2618356 RepID=UPI001FF1487C|nr:MULTISPECIES: TetR family transcriptional regulator [unclassified Amycolatopsis]UOZ09080.1 TetR family transcriptional regulator [Amycolatopsis sp. WQ 127309]WSJ75335.1 TetR family transcriptional regulator [Amycolatopsis sp. NBC_01307]WSK81009.1 TetR family transcriptional regulator [Amycolatopsis sp. NBC_01286]